jgi:hypothetical protein
MISKISYVRLFHGTVAAETEEKRFQEQIRIEIVRDDVSMTFGQRYKTFYCCNYTTSGIFLYDFDWVTPIAT